MVLYLLTFITELTRRYLQHLAYNTYSITTYFLKTSVNEQMIYVKVTRLTIKVIQVKIFLMAAVKKQNYISVKYESFFS